MSDEIDLLPPIDYLAIEFDPGADVGAALAPVLELADSGSIAVLDLEFVVKGDDGAASFVDVAAVTERTGADLAAWDGAWSGLLDDDDLAAVGDRLAPGSIAAVVLYENAWVAALAERCRRNGGRVFADGAVTADDLVAALDRVEAD